MAYWYQHYQYSFTRSLLLPPAAEYREKRPLLERNKSPLPPTFFTNSRKVLPTSHNWESEQLAKELWDGVYSLSSLSDNAINDSLFVDGRTKVTRFLQVILRPLVVVRSGFEAAISHLADQRFFIRAEQAAVLIF